MLLKLLCVSQSQLSQLLDLWHYSVDWLPTYGNYIYMSATSYGEASVLRDLLLHVLCIYTRLSFLWPHCSAGFAAFPRRLDFDASSKSIYFQLLSFGPYSFSLLSYLLMKCPLLSSFDLLDTLGLLFRLIFRILSSSFLLTLRPKLFRSSFGQTG